jgi:hypothetical protein
MDLFSTPKKTVRQRRLPMVLPLRCSADRTIAPARQQVGPSSAPSHPPVRYRSAVLSFLRLCISLPTPPAAPRAVPLWAPGLASLPTTPPRPIARLPHPPLSPLPPTRSHCGHHRPLAPGRGRRPHLQPRPRSWTADHAAEDAAVDSPPWTPPGVYSTVSHPSR